MYDAFTINIFYSYYRTVEDVQTVIQHAKLSDSDLHPLTQVLSFAPRTEVQGKYKFLELDATLLNNLQKGQRYLIKMVGNNFRIRGDVLIMLMPPNTGCQPNCGM